MLTGCVSVEFGSELSDDGSGRHWIGVTFPTSELERPEFPGINSTLDNIVAEAEAAGLEVTTVEEGDLVTVSVSTEQTDSEDVGAALNSLLNATGINASPGIVAPFQGTFRQKSEAVGGTVYVLDLMVDGEQLFESLAVLGTGDFEALPPEQIRQQLELEYFASLPGEVTETNGELIDLNTVRWQIPLAGTVDLTATSKESESGSGLLFTISGLIFAALTALATVAIVRILLRRRQLARHIHDAVPDLPQATKDNIAGLWIARKIRPIVLRIWQSSGSSSPPPISDSLLEPGKEVDELGAHTEGNRPVAGVYSSGTGAETASPRPETQPPGSRSNHH